MVHHAFNLDSAVESILSMLEKDIHKGSEQISGSAGRIEVVVDKKGEKYSLRLESDGHGVTKVETKEILSVIGQSSITGGKSPLDDFWILAPFYFSPNSYTFASNPRTDGEEIVATHTSSGFEIIDDPDTENAFGLKIELTISTDDHTVPEIGETIRRVARDEISVPVKYELQEGGVSEEQIFINT